MIGCDCPVCLSNNPKDHRLRASVLVEIGQQVLVVDCGPDFRQQMLRTNVKHLDALLLTHAHNDHIIGLDDVRPFNFRQKKDMLVYATKAVEKALLQRFDYIFASNPYPGAPRVTVISIDQTPFDIAGTPIIPIEVQHGKLPVLGFRFGNLCYITDMKTISPEEKEKLKGIDILIINALHHKPHPSHLNLEEALAFIEEIRPLQAFLTHVSHSMGLADEVNAQLPGGVALAYDGQVVNGRLTVNPISS